MLALNPYLSFERNAREAMEFYQEVFGGTLDVSTFDQFPGMTQDPGDGALVMHAQLSTPDGLTLMASDTPAGMTYAAPAGISVSISGDDAAKLQSWWDALSDGGTVTMPYDTPPWGGRFGMLRDRYGIDWMVALDASPDAAPGAAPGA